MTSFRKHTMLKPWRSFLFELERAPSWVWALAVFLILLINGSSLGLSDDEAYYWVLAQSPALGYAFHPPAVAWFIGISEWALGWLHLLPSAALVRLPAALSVAGILWMSLNWLRKARPEGNANAWGSARSALVLLSFWGFFALAWMMVPDIPLFLGWTMVFTATWSLCFQKARSLDYLKLGVGSCLVLLSKYSAVLALFSAFVCLFKERRMPFSQRAKGIGVLVFGAILALVPIIIWNYQHEWASLLYQIRDRHGGEVSWLRYGRFWLAEVLLAGPVAVGAFFYLLFKSRESRSSVLEYAGVWALPAALVFCIQPLWSDFKLHWAFVVWWPVILALSWMCENARHWRWIRYQVFYGLLMGGVVLVSCHLPIGSWILLARNGPTGFDPRLDVTNDFYGWSDLGGFLKEALDSEVGQLPVVGSRYQTASQAAFALGGTRRVTFLPRSVKEKDEWPDLAISDGQGPAWPKLNQPLIYVADNRYDTPPAFPEAHCEKKGRFETRRHEILVRWIDVWRCNP